MQRKTALLFMLGSLVGASVALATHWSPCFGGAAFAIHVPQSYVWTRAGVPNSPRTYFATVGSESTQWRNGTCVNSVEPGGPLYDMRFKANFYGQTGWLGQWAPTGTIDCENNGTVQLNRTYLDTAPQSQTTSTACHEIGHGLGLNHRSGTTSCMVAGNEFPVNFDSHDAAIVNQNYQNHGDGCL